ncbi:MAG: putative toxin-antitoxin system toxin component, PIN family [Acidobacteriota bacterium]|nr:putative toxin-antitoxin system toxin component, PIN family [Acidobacteriota bacterium]
MRVILDTNVFVSAVFFGGPPGRILEEWRGARVQPVLSAEIFEEYRRVGEILVSRYPGVDLEPVLALLIVHGEFVQAPALPEPVAADPDDDKFLACAVAAGVEVIVSGDKHLLEQSEWHGIKVLRPRQFVDDYL